MRGAFVLLVAGIPLWGCSVLGNRYDAQYNVVCSPMSVEELRTELRRDADRIALIIGQPVHSAASDPRLEIVVPKTDPSFWRGAQPVIIRMFVGADYSFPPPDSMKLFIAVYRPDNPSEDERIIKSRKAVESVLKSSNCPTWNLDLNRFSLVA